MPENLEKLMSKIELEKEILSTLPTNTKKNKEAYIAKVQELKKEYEEYKEKVLQAIVKRYNDEVQISENSNLTEIENQIKELEEVRNVISNAKNVYEKTGLDKEIFNLKRFYKKNLATVNNIIANCVKIFDKVGIEFDYRDFNFTEYTKQYMDKFLKEARTGVLDLDIMQNEFEKIYWKSPDILLHLQLNFRYIFLKKEAEIIKYYNDQKGMAQTSLSDGISNIEEKYRALNKEYIEKNKEQKEIIVNRFLSGELNIKDYEDKSISKTYSRFINLDTLEEKREEINLNLIKLLHNLYEYRNYLKYKFIFDDMKTKYLEEGDEKTTYNSIKKQIIDSVEALNNNAGGFKLFKKTAERKSMQEISSLFEELDKVEVEEKIKEKLTQKSTIKEMGEVAAAFYKYLFISIIENDKEIEEPQIIGKIEEFKKFIDYPYNTISESISMMDDKEIALIIKDRYTLFDIKITKDQLDEGSINSLINDLEKIENYYYIQKANIDLNKIDGLYKMKKIVTDNQKR